MVSQAPPELGGGNGATRKEKREKVKGSQVGGGGRKVKGDRRAGSCPGLPWIAPPPGAPASPSTLRSPQQGLSRWPSSRGLGSEDQ